MPLEEFLGPEVPLPDEVQDIEVLGDVTTDQTRRLMRAPSRPTTRARRSTTRPPRSPRSSTCDNPPRTRPWCCWSPTGTTTSAWTRSPARSATPGAPRVVFDAGDDTSTGEDVGGLQPRLGELGLRRPRPRSAWPATTTTARSCPATWPTAAGRCSTARWSRSRRHPAARCRRPAVQRPGQLARRDRAELRGGRQTALGRRVRRADEGRVATMLVHDANLARRGAGPGLRRPRRRRPHARAGRADPGGRPERCGRLHLHDRDDGRGGVRHRHRQQAASTAPASR